MASGIFWNLEIGNLEIWKFPEMGWFGTILTCWSYFPLSLGHWAWLWSQNSKIPIFLEYDQKFSGNLEIPRNGLIWTNFDELGIISTQFLFLSSILNSEFPDSNFFWNFNQKFPGNLQISRNGLVWTNLDILGLFPTQFWSLIIIVKSEFQNSNFSGILPEIFGNLENHLNFLFALRITIPIFWNFEFPEMGWFGPILLYWVYFPVSLAHWSLNFRIPIFLEFCQKLKFSWNSLELAVLFQFQHKSERPCVSVY